MNYSAKRVGFTSAMRSGFVFEEGAEFRNYPNHVNTQFKASEKAVSLIEQLDDAKVTTVMIDGDIVVLAADEAESLGLQEVMLKVVNKQTDNAKWIAVPALVSALINNDLNWYVCHLESGGFELKHQTQLSNILQCGEPCQQYGYERIERCWNGEDLSDESYW